MHCNESENVLGFFKPIRSKRNTKYGDLAFQHVFPRYARVAFSTDF